MASIRSILIAPLALRPRRRETLSMKPRALLALLLICIVQAHSVAQLLPITFVPSGRGSIDSSPKKRRPREGLAASRPHDSVHLPFVRGKREKAYPEQTPHSGRHFWPSHPAYRRSGWSRLLRGKRRARFMEGWYYRLTLVEHNVSFAFIVSIEDPGKKDSDLTLACVQVVGPQDGYLVQADRDDTKFWAWEYQQGLGYAFEWNDHIPIQEACLATALSPSEWRRKVRTGFQVLPDHIQARIDGHDGSLGGVLDGQGEPGSCEFDIAIDPICGFGSQANRKQKSTAGWLASFAVFEPHWQVTLADARASGRVVWKNQTYDFDGEPFYAEKNWGAALPSKWYWTQCNSFDGYTGSDEPQLAVTAGGGVRQIPFGQRESLGMISVHYNGSLYEAVPWTGSMQWEVATWGSWNLTGRCTEGEVPFEVRFVCRCDPAENPGLVFRAPTPDEGMVYFCRDTFEANCELSLWALRWDATRQDYVRRGGPPIIDAARSTQGGAEVGGGPWWDTWRRISNMKQPMKALVQLPYRVQQAQRRLSFWRRDYRNL